jgi:ectoine hydroxylase-related dioxygenase (phytanoyl-CoA dioxygenase family)
METKAITLFTGSHRMLISWARWTKPTHPDHSYLRNIFYFPSIQAEVFQVHIFPSDFPTKSLYVFLFSTIHAAHLDHLICLDMTAQTIVIFGEVVSKLFFM